MRVDNPKTDRLEMPEECDCCGYPAQLTRYYHYGPWHQVEWLCPYCANSHDKDETISKSIASMLNELEKRIKEASHE